MKHKHIKEIKSVFIKKKNIYIFIVIIIIKEIILFVYFLFFSLDEYFCCHLFWSVL